jgi:hypothetical protein
LKAFIAKHRVAVLLNGHVHEAGVRNEAWNGWRYLEATCGTTCQRTRTSQRLVNRFAPKHLCKWNSLLVHELRQVGPTRFSWASEDFHYRSVRSGFEPSARAHARGSIEVSV